MSLKDVIVLANSSECHFVFGDHEQQHSFTKSSPPQQMGTAFEPRQRCTPVFSSASPSVNHLQSHPFPYMNRKIALMQTLLCRNFLVLERVVESMSLEC